MPDGPAAPSVRNAAVLIVVASVASNTIGCTAGGPVVVLYNAFVEIGWPGGCLDNRASRTVHEACSVPLPKLLSRCNTLPIFCSVINRRAAFVLP